VRKEGKEEGMRKGRKREGLMDASEKVRAAIRNPGGGCKETREEKRSQSSLSALWTGVPDSLLRKREKRKSPWTAEKGQTP